MPQTNSIRYKITKITRIHEWRSPRGYLFPYISDTIILYFAWSCFRIIWGIFDTKFNVKIFLVILIINRGWNVGEH